jgi:hypothetical protein
VKQTQIAIVSMLLSIATVAMVAACGSKDSSPVGTYVIVKDKALTEALEAMAGHDSPELAAAKVKEMLEALEMTLVLKADKTFSVTGNMGGKFEASGTWALSGQELTVTATHENGKARSEPEVNKLVYDGTTIRMPKDEKSQPFEMVLRRK